MMKKQYIIPQVKIVVLASTVSLLAGSDLKLRTTQVESDEDVY